MKKRTRKQPLKRALIYYHSFLEYVNGSIANRFKEKREKHIDRKWHVINKVLDNIAKESGLYDKYLNADVSDLKPIGNRVWMFWYTGFDTAPPIVKKCAELASRLEEVDLVLIDKNNLEEYFTFEGNIKDLFYKEKISLPHFADILRCQLLSRYGGFWFDATLFCTQTDFIPRHKDLNYFSCKQSVCSHFTQGLWSTWCCASGKDNPLFAFLYEMFILYFNRYDTILDYIQFDYTWMYAYVKFEWVAEMIDDLRYTSTNATVLIDNFGKMYNQLFFEHIMKTNLFLKLNWKKIPVPINENTLLDRFMHL